MRLRPSARAVRGAAAGDVEALDAFGREAGLAFQLIDDVIGTMGRPAPYRQAGRRGDLGARKKSLPPVVAALTSGTPAAAELRRVVRGPPYDEGKEDLERTALAVERGGRPGLGPGPGGRPDGEGHAGNWPAPCPTRRRRAASRWPSS